jgi:hypothetical protein
MDTFGQTLAKDLIELLRKYNLREEMIIYVKYQSSNLNIMIVTLKFVVNFNILGLWESFQGSCFGHAFFKAYQYVTTYEFFCTGLMYLSELNNLICKNL